MPYRHWKTTTFIAGPSSLSGVDGAVRDRRPVNRRLILRPGSSSALVPELRPGDVVILDNLASTQGPTRTRRCRGGRSPVALPPAIQPRLQPDRKRLRQAQSLASPGAGALHRYPLADDRTAAEHRADQPTQEPVTRSEPSADEWLCGLQEDKTEGGNRRPGTAGAMPMRDPADLAARLLLSAALKRSGTPIGAIPVVPRSPAWTDALADVWETRLARRCPAVGW